MCMQNHTMTPELLPSFGLGAHSYCRNPDHSEDGVWCYVKGPPGQDSPLRGFCDVPLCLARVSLEVGKSGIGSTVLSNVRPCCHLQPRCWQRQRVASSVGCVRGMCAQRTASGGMCAWEVCAARISRFHRALAHALSCMHARWNRCACHAECVLGRDGCRDRRSGSGARSAVLLLPQAAAVPRAAGEGGGGGAGHDAAPGARAPAHGCDGGLGRQQRAGWRHQRRDPAHDRRHACGRCAAIGRRPPG
jgi:hypothetical protein